MMKKPIFIRGLVFLMMINGLYAQQGNVAAGGDGSGAGGSISYSVGQTDYLMFSSDQGSICFGLQHAWVSSGVPALLVIPNTTINSGQASCFNASETVVVAGDGKYFTVESGGEATVIAAQNILLKAGTHIKQGGYLHAYISTQYCTGKSGVPEPVIAEEVVTKINPEILINDDLSFRVYPNPTKGDFTLELNGFADAPMITVAVFNMLGGLIFSHVLPVDGYHRFSLSGHQPGLYLVRVTNNALTGTVKIIKQ